MISIEGSERPIQFWVGASLKPFGANPYRESLFRVVLKSSRFQLFGGTYVERDSTMLTDREVLAAGRDKSIVRERAGYRWQPMYMGRDAYILEKWMSAIEYTGLTPAMYDMNYKDPETGLLSLGPYPRRGEFFNVWEFTPGYPTASAVESAIRMCLYSRKFTQCERCEAMIEADKKDRLDKRNRNADLILDSMPAFGLNPASTNPARKTPDDYKLRYAAHELGLPVGENKVFTQTPR
jgi:hypothetical protein